MISTGGTLVKASEALLKRGATEVYCLATHGIFAGDAVAQFDASAIKKVIVTNTIPKSAHPAGMGDKIEQLSIAQILADAIKRITANRSVSELFAGDDFVEHPENAAAAADEDASFVEAGNEAAVAAAV
jgi:ribose-phosphate pyrophosphokinase